MENLNLSVVQVYAFTLLIGGLAGKVFQWYYRRDMRIARESALAEIKRIQTELDLRKRY